jgi:predicted membrane channel-forming protein YqfA (hemolysin III family)
MMKAAAFIAWFALTISLVVWTQRGWNRWSIMPSPMFFWGGALLLLGVIVFGVDRIRDTQHRMARNKMTPAERLGKYYAANPAERMRSILGESAAREREEK